MGLWLLDSKLGRFLVAVGGIVAICGAALIAAFSSGRQREKAKRDREAFKSLRDAVEKQKDTRDETRRMGDDDLDRANSRWLRK
jgi:hypothetical protein